MRSGVLYMNKRLFINTLCASAIAVVMSACSHTYPPSRYIGIFDSYDGYKNGELPFNGNYLYSGTWSTSYPQSKQIRVQGSYYKGKPDGKWKSFYRNGDLQFLQFIVTDKRNKWYRTTLMECLIRFPNLIKR